MHTCPSIGKGDETFSSPEPPGPQSPAAKRVKGSGNENGDEKAKLGLLL